MLLIQKDGSLNSFLFKKQFSFFSQSYILQYLGKEYTITTRKSFLKDPLEFTFGYSDGKGHLKIKHDNINSTKFVGVINKSNFYIEYSNKEFSIESNGLNYDIIFQKGLNAGIFRNDINLGIIDQRIFWNGILQRSHTRNYFIGNLDNYIAVL